MRSGRKWPKSTIRIAMPRRVSSARNRCGRSRRCSELDVPSDPSSRVPVVIERSYPSVRLSGQKRTKGKEIFLREPATLIEQPAVRHFPMNVLSAPGKISPVKSNSFMARHVETAADFADFIVVHDPNERPLKHCGQNETMEAHSTDDIDVGECFDDGRRIGSRMAGFNRSRRDGKFAADFGKHIRIACDGAALLEDEKDHSVALFLPKPDGVRQGGYRFFVCERRNRQTDARGISGGWPAPSVRRQRSPRKDQIL